ncbi:hypothetical protein AN191_14710 [Loktanella sp. 5RATIMAR09]|nr:hypothetical protein AN191_14710 [Loktanella sp. 5RATIMAR09]
MQKNDQETDITCLEGNGLTITQRPRPNRRLLYRVIEIKKRSSHALGISETDKALGNGRRLAPATASTI